MEIRDRVVVVTGGASGLGLACVRRMQKEGGRIAILDKDSNGLHSLSAEGIPTWEVDMSDAEAVESAFEEIRMRLGPASILVNCAHISHHGSVVQSGAPMPLEEFQHVVRVNLLGTINSVRCAAAQMMETSTQHEGTGGEHGAIINTSSIAATDGQVGQVAYAAAMGGLSSMTLPLARELGRYGIRINTIAPGIFDTPLTSSSTEVISVTTLSAEQPFPRRAGKPEEFAEAVLAMVRQPMFNGAVVRLDGGLRMPAHF